MLNIFKKTKQVAVATEARGNYPAIVHEIHNEFMTAGDRLSAEAKAILSKDALRVIEKGQRLAALGFTQVPEAKRATGLCVTDELAKLVEYYQMNYPLNKFITESQVAAICKKYNLFCGDVTLYKGFVPEKNLTEIERFNIKDQDKNVVELLNTCVTNVSLGWYNNNELPKNEYIIAGGVLKDKESCIVKQIYEAAVALGVRQDTIYIQRRNRAAIMQICAPLKDMDTKGLRVGEYKIEQHYPDPVVLRPVHGGYLIVTAWGDEASDELVINEKQN